MKTEQKIRQRITEINETLSSGAPLNDRTREALVSERYALRWVVAK